MLGDPTGIDALRESLELGLESGAAAETALAYTNLAGQSFDSEGPLPSLALYDQGIEFGERRGQSGTVWWMRGERVWPLFSMGGGTSSWRRPSSTTETLRSTSWSRAIERTY